MDFSFAGWIGRSAAFLIGAVSWMGSATAQPIVVDNEDPGFSESGSWFVSSNPGFYGSNSLYAYTTSTNPPVATWSAALPADGNYRIAVRFVASTNRATNAPYTVSFAGGTETVPVNQTTNNGTWITLGTYPFGTGQNASVTLTADANGTVVSADAVRFERLGSTGGCGPLGDTLVRLQSSEPCNLCGLYLLPGSHEPHPVVAYDIHSDLPERFLTPGVLYATVPVLPPFSTNNGTPVTLSQRTQENHGFQTIDDAFDIFVFHISSPGDGSAPRRVAAYVRNDGTGPVTIDPRQILVTDGIIGTVHEMESTLGRRVLEDDWDTPVGPFIVQPGEGAVVAYSKKFSIIGNGPDSSQNINCFGRVRAEVENSDEDTHPTDLTVYVVGIPAQNPANNLTLVEQYLDTGAQSGETFIDLNSQPLGCALSRTTGVMPGTVWRSDLVTLDVASIEGSGVDFQMALPAIQSAGCEEARQTVDMLLQPPYSRDESIGNYMIEYRVELRFVNRDTRRPATVDLSFGKTGADIGLAWQMAIGDNPPTDAEVDAADVHTGWAGPNQSAIERSFFETPLELQPCSIRYLSMRFLILGNASLPFFMTASSERDDPIPYETDAWIVRE